MSPLSINPPEAGSLVALADDLYWMRFTLPFRLNHINLYAFDTKDGWLLLDCGINSEAIANQWAMMLKGPWRNGYLRHYRISLSRRSRWLCGQLAKITSAPVYMGAVEHEQAIWGLAQSDEYAGGLLAKTYARFGLSDEVVNRVRQEGNYYRKLAGDLPDVKSSKPVNNLKQSLVPG